MMERMVVGADGREHGMKLKTMWRRGQREAYLRRTAALVRRTRGSDRETGAFTVPVAPALH